MDREKPERERGSIHRISYIPESGTLNTLVCRLEAGLPEQERESSLRFQTRCVRCYPDGTGFAVSSVEGRVAMEYFDQSEAGQTRKYAFKCHRSSEAGTDTVHPVNSIAFHPVHGTFATGGARRVSLILQRQLGITAVLHGYRGVFGAAFSTGEFCFSGGKPFTEKAGRLS